VLRAAGRSQEAAGSYRKVWQQGTMGNSEVCTTKWRLSRWETWFPARRITRERPRPTEQVGEVKQPDAELLQRANLRRERCMTCCRSVIWL